MVASDWNSCRNILVIRPDNMGDLLMSSPAIRALKDSFGARITVLTSSMAAGIAGMIPEIDEVMVYDVPWVKSNEAANAESFSEIISLIKAKNFDAAIIFTVYSQNPLPTAMLAFLAGIPRRLAYCRENPYGLLTDWFPDPEPFTIIKHQVRRDLDLVASIGATTENDHLSLQVDTRVSSTLEAKLEQEGVDVSKPYLILHPGVSEKKREYPPQDWIETGKLLAQGHQLLITGGPSERELTEGIRSGIGPNAFSLAGKISLKEFIFLIDKASLVISVNTGTIHIAAATCTPLVVLYAFSNPQHFPWKSSGCVLLYDIPQEIRSKNEIIRYVNELYIPAKERSVSPDDIVRETQQILAGKGKAIVEMPQALEELPHPTL
ncbi:glycosyltransferase family 9 protein [Desertivirga brevis]|uniref:glycosyltransferase family 9 protein n=1 Tax=Desertivirga brevis TaxID=2810310 RepID=UPI001A95F586|nr:glycosyltransferase family 9 protein [Pedobacter sp. SYSU D00873]